VTAKLILFPVPPSTKLERLLALSLERANDLERAMLDGYTPARINHDVPIAAFSNALALAGLTFDCVDGEIVIRKRRHGDD